MANVRAFLDFDNATFREMVRYSTNQLRFVQDHFMKSNFTWRVRDDFDSEIQSILLRLSDDAQCWDAKREKPDMEFLLEATGTEGVISGVFNGVPFELNPQGFFDELLLPEWTNNNVVGDWKELGARVGYASANSTLYVQDRYMLANREGWKESIQETLLAHVRDVVDVHRLESLHLILVFEKVNLPESEGDDLRKPRDFTDEASRKLDSVNEMFVNDLNDLGCRFTMQAHMVHSKKASKYHDRYLVWNQFTLSLATGVVVPNEKVRIWYNVGKADNVDLTRGQVARFCDHFSEDIQEESSLRGNWKYHGVCRPVKMSFNFICNWAYPWKKRERLNWPAFNIS